ncbi:ATP-binding protein [Microcoleus sp. ZQ-A2]|nr:ATP-binding protein [Microcoleus sp. FACHB-1]
MSQYRPVPRLDLAPKLRRPLSLWNPLDYLRLLYWVFFFPQALRWYVHVYDRGLIPNEHPSWKNVWGLLPSVILRQLVFQGITLTIITPLIQCIVLNQLGFILDYKVVLGNANSMFFLGIIIAFLIIVLKTEEKDFNTRNVTQSSIALGVGLGITLNLALSIFSAPSKEVFTNWTAIVALPILGGFWIGVASVVVLSILIIDVSNFVVVAVGIGMLLLSGLMGLMMPGQKVATDWKIVQTVLFFMSSSAASIVGSCLAFLRPDNWLFSLPLAEQSYNNNLVWQLCRVTLLPIPYLSSQLKDWLRHDWEKGIKNAKQIFAYTLQFMPVINALNQVLAEIPLEQVIYRVAQLAEPPCSWELLRYVSVPWFSNPFRFRTDTAARAAAAGFWHLHQKEPTKAMEAFAVVRSLPYGEEMFTITQILAAFRDAQELAIVAAALSASPKEPLLCPDTWKTFARLRRVVEDVQVVERSVSRSARAFALNRALGELTDILDKADTLPQAEQGLIVDIAQIWQKGLLQLAGEVGEISITEPVRNPYMVGDPVEGNLFVGREGVLSQLEELWVMGHRLQSVVLYGHRRMGKTSILLNAAKCSGSEVKVAYVNLLCLGDSPQGVGEVLMAITDAISEAVGCTPPTDDDLLNLPYRTFERYLKQVEAHLSGGLIVALDEFEKIEELIEAEKIPKDFMGYLRGLVQMSSKVAFAFAGLHTLEEMTADYFQPFFASVIPIHVGFLQPGATRQILANPTDDDSSLSSPRGGGIEGGEFPLDYTPEALDQIYTLTAGQPYLVQLVGFQLVRRYNDYVFEQGRPRDPVFTIEDVEAVINDPEFFKRGRYYFDGVWGQAARGASGQQAILKALAPHPEGLSIDALAQATAMDEETLQEALKTLMRHDVVQEREGCWQIIVELFRRWVLQA